MDKLCFGGNLFAGRGGGAPGADNDVVGADEDVDVCGDEEGVEAEREFGELRGVDGFDVEFNDIPGSTAIDVPLPRPISGLFKRPGGDFEPFTFPAEFPPYDPIFPNVNEFSNPFPSSIRWVK